MIQALTVPRERWTSLIALINQQTAARPVRIEVVDRVLGDQEMGKLLPFRAIHLETKGSERGSIIVGVGGESGELNHIIKQPTGMHLGLNDFSEVTWVAIEDRQGKTIIHFHQLLALEAGYLDEQPSVQRAHMRTRSLGWTGISVPVIGQGTWLMDQEDRETCIATLRVGLEAGMSHIDTSEVYGDGYVESAIVSEAISGRRGEVFLASKVHPKNASFEGTIAACERSLRRLRTDYLDLYLLQRRSNHPLLSTIAAFEHLVEQGKIRTWGVSNFDTDDVAEAVEVAGPRRMVCNQVLYHLEERAIERDLVPSCEEARTAVVAYAPLAHGRFPEPDSHGGQVLAAIGQVHDVSPRTVALAFLVRHPSVFAIPRTAQPAHARANAAAGDLRLSPSEISRIETAFRSGPPPIELPVLPGGAEQRSTP